VGGTAAFGVTRRGDHRANILALDAAFFPRSLFQNGARSIGLALWTLYFFVSERVRRVFRDPRLGGRTPNYDRHRLVIRNSRSLNGKRYSCRARRNEVTENATNTKPTMMEIAISQWVASRVHARSAMLSQPRARRAKIAPMTSWNNCLNTRQSRRNPCGSAGRLALPATVDIAAS
jgi:hypothetical protein